MSEISDWKSINFEWFQPRERQGRQQRGKMLTVCEGHDIDIRLTEVLTDGGQRGHLQPVAKEVPLSTVAY